MDSSFGKADGGKIKNCTGHFATIQDSLWHSCKWRKNKTMMQDHMDVRRFPRICDEEGCSIQFQAGDRWVFWLPVTSIGGGGCRFRVFSRLEEGRKNLRINS